MEVLKQSPAKAVRSDAVFRADLMKGKVVVVTGGGSGIGLGICKAFARHGARVGICGRTEAKLAKAAEEIRAEGAEEVRFHTADVRLPESCAAAVAGICEPWGNKIDVLVNCAAGNFMALAEDMSSRAFGNVIDIDLKGTFNFSTASLPYLSRAKGATIINISATLQYKAQPFQTHAAAAKAGIDVLTETLGCEWAEYGVRCVGIAPGPVAGTEGGPTGRVFGKLIGSTDPAATCPVGRYGETDDIANAALFLASPAATWITSTTLVVDGAQWHSVGPLVTHKAQIRKALAGQKAAQKAKKSDTAKL